MHRNQAHDSNTRPLGQNHPQVQTNPKRTCTLHLKEPVNLLSCLSWILSFTAKRNFTWYTDKNGLLLVQPFS